MIFSRNAIPHSRIRFKPFYYFKVIVLICGSGSHWHFWGEQCLGLPATAMIHTGHWPLWYKFDCKPALHHHPGIKTAPLCESRLDVGIPINSIESSRCQLRSSNWMRREMNNCVKKPVRCKFSHHCKIEMRYNLAIWAKSTGSRLALALR